MLDLALEKSRRYAWARYFAQRRDLEDTLRRFDDMALRRAEIAAYVEALDPPAEHPVWVEIAAAYEAISPADLGYVRRYVQSRLDRALPLPFVREGASA